MKKTFFTIVTLAVLSVSAAFAQSNAKDQATSTQEVEEQSYAIAEDILYSDSKDEYAVNRCRLDVYYPEGVNDVPVIVWFHGGGLTGGSKFVPAQWKNSGIVVVAVNYRLIPKVGIADCIEDAAQAVAWTFRNIVKYGGDPDKIFVVGHSAGGYLTSMIGLEKKWLIAEGVNPDRIAGLVPISGQAITHFAQRNLQGIGPLQATVDEFAPLYHVRGDASPIFLISADREKEMNGRYEEQAYFWRMLKLCGHKDVRIVELPGYDHGGVADPGFELTKDYIRDILDSRK